MNQLVIFLVSVYCTYNFYSVVFIHNIFSSLIAVVLLHETTKNVIARKLDYENNTSVDVLKTEKNGEKKIDFDFSAF